MLNKIINSHEKVVDVFVMINNLSDSIKFLKEIYTVIPADYLACHYGGSPKNAYYKLKSKQEIIKIIEANIGISCEELHSTQNHHIAEFISKLRPTRSDLKTSMDYALLSASAYKGLD